MTATRSTAAGPLRIPALLVAGMMLAALSACAAGPRATAPDAAAETAPGGVPLSGGIGTSGLCPTLPQARVPANCAGI